MLDLNSLSPGSFNGSSFLIESTSVKGGRKTIVHEFPNQDTRYVEDLGLLNETITIKASIPTADYFGGRDSLKASLEFEGYGTLVHPYYGVRNAICQSYSIDESTVNFGFVEISMDLVVGQELNFPGSGGGLLGSFTGIFTAVSSFLTAISSSFNTWYPIEYLDSRARRDLQTLSADIWKHFRASAGTYTIQSGYDASAQSDFYRALTVQELAPGAAILSADTFLETITSIANKYDAVTLDGMGGLDAATRLGNFVTTIALPASSKNQQIIQNGCYQALVLGVETQALAAAARNIAVADFTTSVEVASALSAVWSLADSIRTKLSTYSSTTFRARTGQKEPNTSETLDALKTIEVACATYLNNQYSLVSNIETLKVTDLPLSLVVYGVYGEMSRDDQIRLLNFPEQLDTNIYSGDISILTVK